MPHGSPQANFLQRSSNPRLHNFGPHGHVLLRRSPELAKGAHHRARPIRASEFDA